MLSQGPRPNLIGDRVGEEAFCFDTKQHSGRREKKWDI